MTAATTALALCAGGCDTGLNSSQYGGSDGPSGDGGGQLVSGLPCDVAQLLRDNCLSCHSNPPNGGATMPLVTRADLTALSPLGGSYAARALVRMQDAKSPMPPGNPLPANQVAILQTWVNAGMPAADCTAGGDDGGVPPTDYNTPDTCTSNLYWMGGEQDWGSYPKSAMHPGAACIDCHDNPEKYGKQDTGPTLLIAGTVYPSAHEFDECFGVNGHSQPIDVEITDNNMTVVTAHAGVSGDFYLRPSLVVQSLAFPIKARLLSGGKPRAMSQSVNTGDCNSCHTLRGDQKAPGRIMAP